MKELRIYIIVFLVLFGGLMLNILPQYVYLLLDTFTGRVFGFSMIVIMACLLGIQEAILFGAVLGLMIVRSHDTKVGALRLQGLTTQQSIQSSLHPLISVSEKAITSGLKMISGNRGGIIHDMTPTYSGRVAQRLGLIPMESHRNILENSNSFQL